MALFEILQHPLFGTGLNLLGIILGVLSVIVGYVQYRLRQREKKPLWSIKHINLIQDYSSRIPGLSIKYGDESIEALSVSKIVFWNAGSETIRGDDIADADPLAILLPNNARLLDASITATNSKPSRFRLYTKPEINGSFLTFDFLDRNNGVVVQLIHTGVMANDINIAGTIMGASRPAQNAMGYSSLESFAFFFAYYGSILGIVVAGVSLIALLDLNPWLYLLTSLVIVCSAFWIPAYLLRHHEPRGLRRIPRELRTHFYI
jgi:hypothetical protein